VNLNGYNYSITIAITFTSNSSNATTLDAQLAEVLDTLIAKEVDELRRLEGDTVTSCVSDQYAIVVDASLINATVSVCDAQTQTILRAEFDEHLEADFVREVRNETGVTLQDVQVETTTNGENKVSTQPQETEDNMDLIEALLAVIAVLVLVITVLFVIWWRRYRKVEDGGVDVGMTDVATDGRGETEPGYEADVKDGNTAGVGAADGEALQRLASHSTPHGMMAQDSADEDMYDAVSSSPDSPATPRLP